MVLCWVLSFEIGCDECDVGHTWCDDGDVMVCVAEDDESEEDDDWESSDESDDEDGSWVDVIIAIFQIADAADGEGRAEVRVSCSNQNLVCVERSDAENSDVGAVCEAKTDW